nr:unnamed protein product [Callosobruchus chinensis]
MKFLIKKYHLFQKASIIGMGGSPKRKTLSWTNMDQIFSSHYLYQTYIK